LFPATGPVTGAPNGLRAKSKILAAIALGLFAAVGGGLVVAEEVARPVEKNLNLPPEWNNVPPEVRLAAERVASVDADRLLSERVYGLELNANTLVLDLALASDDIRTSIDTAIKGIRTKETTYKPDLTVEVVKEITNREIIETISKIVNTRENKLGVNKKEWEDIKRENRDTVLGVMGNGAVPDSIGHKKIQTKRAAEIECYRKLAERVVGIKINSNTTVKSLMLQSDQIVSQVSAHLAGVKFTSIFHVNDGTCEVTGKLVLRQVIEVIERMAKKHVVNCAVTEEEWKNVRIENRDKELVETGKAAPRREQVKETIAPAKPDQETFRIQRQVIRRVIGKEIGVND